jgi:hypothetical protein
MWTHRLSFEEMLIRCRECGRPIEISCGELICRNCVQRKGEDEGKKNSMDDGDGQVDRICVFKS